MLIITGDTHNRYDGRRLDSDVFDYTGLTKKDYILIAGDFGYVWHGDERDDEELDKLSALPVTILFIDGNHENFDALDAYEKKDWHGGKVHFIRPDIIHLLRGEIYDIEGYSVFTFGGAYSVDRELRTPGVSWWPQELPNEEEYAHGKENLQAHGNKVDLLVTHEVTTTILKSLYSRARGYTLSHYFEELDHSIDFGHWYFGHHHQEIEFDEKHSLLYNNYAYLEPKNKDDETGQ